MTFEWGFVVDGAFFGTGIERSEKIDDGALPGDSCHSKIRGCNQPNSLIDSAFFHYKIYTVLATFPQFEVRPNPARATSATSVPIA